MRGLIDFYRNYKVEFWRFSIFNCAAATDHLNKMAAKGLRLIMVRQAWPRVAVFRRETEPVCGTFAVDVFERTETDEDAERDYCQLYRDGGWLPIKGDRADGVRFFYNDSPSAPLLFTDRESEVIHVAEECSTNSQILKRIGCGFAEMVIGWFFVFRIEGDLIFIWLKMIHIFMIILLIHGVLKMAAAIGGCIYYEMQRNRIEKGKSPWNGGIFRMVDSVAEWLIVMTMPVLLNAIIFALGVWSLTRAGGMYAENSIKGVLELANGLLIVVGLPLLYANYPRGWVENSNVYQWLYGVLIGAIMILPDLIRNID